MTAKDWFKKAQDEGFAIGAFNVDNLEIFRAICMAAKKMKSPVMMEFSQGEVSYFGLANIVDLVVNAREEYRIPILLNLDHAKSVDDCLKAIEVSHSVIPAKAGIHNTDTDWIPHQVRDDGSVGFDDVHFDGSELPYEENVEGVKKVVEAAHANPISLKLRGAREILVEGEIDRLPGSSEVHLEEIDVETLKKSYTDPARAAKFVQETGVDIFAAVFGNVHGTFPNQPDLDFELLKKIRIALPDTFLSMHGGSGIGAEQVKDAIKVGKIVKVNVNTEIRQAFKDALGEELGENPDEAAYYKLTPDIITAVSAVVEGKIDIFGSAGKA